MIRPKREALKGIRKLDRVINGVRRTYFEAYLGTDVKGRKIRVSRPTKAEAVQAVDGFYALQKKHGDAAVRILTPFQIHDARAALDILQNAGMSGVCLSECARRLVEISGAKATRGKALTDAYSEYLATFPEEALHKKTIGARVGKWVTACGDGKACADVTAADVADYLARRGGAATTRNNALNYIKSFLNWCAAPERGYIGANPAKGMKPVAKPYQEPTFMGVDDVETVLRALERHGDSTLTCYFALSFLTGMRTEEIKRIAQAPGDFNLEDGTIRVSKPKGWTKGIPPRLIHVPGNALEWLVRYDVRASLPKLQTRADKQIRQVLKKASLNIPIPHNAGRHTFITMHYAAHCDPARTAALCGTSHAVMADHYMGLAAKGDGLRYFALRPSGGASPAYPTPLAVMA